MAPRASLPRGPQIRGRVAVGSTRMRRPGSELISSELESSWHAAKRRPGPVRPYGPAAGVLVRLVYLDHDILNIMVSQFLSENILTVAPGLGARDRRRSHRRSLARHGSTTRLGCDYGIRRRLGVCQAEKPGPLADRRGRPGR